MSRIFLSHSSDDKDRVGELAEVLGELGHEVWIDTRLTGGQEWWDRILAEIRNSDYFGIVLTDSSIKSEACNRECEYALALNKPVLPFRLEEDIDIELLDPRLSRLQIIHYGHGDRAGTLHLVKALNHLPPPAPLPDPLPEPPEIPLSYVSKILAEINRRDALSQDEQITIVFRLRDHLRTGGDPQSVEKALQRMKGRQDLYANVYNEIEAVLAELGRSKAGAARTAAAPQDPSRKADPVQRDPVEREPAVRSPAAQGPGGLATSLRAHAAPPVGGAAKEGLSGMVLGLMVLSFLVPLVGIVLYFVWNKERPQSAKRVGLAALAGFVFYLLMTSGY